MDMLAPTTLDGSLAFKCEDTANISERDDIKDCPYAWIRSLLVKFCHRGAFLIDLGKGRTDDCIGSHLISAGVTHKQ